MADDTFTFKGAWVRRIPFSLLCPKCGKGFEETGYVSDKTAMVACSDMCEGPGKLYGVDRDQWSYHQRQEKAYYEAVDREQFERMARKLDDEEGTGE